jgi:hypothetical protein
MPPLAKRAESLKERITADSETLSIDAKANELTAL